MTFITEWIKWLKSDFEKLTFVMKNWITKIVAVNFLQCSSINSHWLYPSHVLVCDRLPVTVQLKSRLRPAEPGSGQANGPGHGRPVRTWNQKTQSSCSRRCMEICIWMSPCLSRWTKCLFWFLRAGPFCFLTWVQLRNMTTRTSTWVLSILPGSSVCLSPPPGLPFYTWVAPRRGDNSW